MADFAAAKSTQRSYWTTAANTLATIVAELEKGTRIGAKKLATAFEAIRPLRISTLKCNFCDTAIAEYNAEHKTLVDKTTPNLCYEIGCPAIPICKENPAKWEVFQCFSCIWYFLEGQFFTGEGNRYPLCKRWCRGFEECEKAVPTDTEKFSPASDEDRLAKLAFCLKWVHYEVVVKQNWVNLIEQLYS